jgi:Mg-chelatase subunit ChlD
VIGIVAFRDSGLAVQAPTNDQGAVLAAISRLAPERGTSLGEGLRQLVDWWWEQKVAEPCRVSLGR